jgi:tetratricopeptide (TPR) repeat protein
LCAATNRNYEDSFQFFNRTREILDNKPDIKLDAGQRYVNTLFHLLRCHTDLGEFERAKTLIEDIRSLQGKKAFKSVDIAVRIVSNTYNQELVLLHALGDFQGSVDLIPTIENLQQQYEGKISKEMDVLITYNKAYSNFGVGEYKRALHYLNEVLNDNEQNLRRDIYSFSRLFNIVIHYELENYDFLEYVVKSTNRYLSKQDRDYQIENVCIKHIRKLAKTIDGVNRLEIFEKMDQEITTLLQDHNERVVLEYFDIASWVKSKLNKSTFAKTIQEGLAEKTA